MTASEFVLRAEIVRLEAALHEARTEIETLEDENARLLVAINHAAEAIASSEASLRELLNLTNAIGEALP